MTTIVFDGDVLAADTQLNCGSTVVGHRSKIIPLSNHRWLAVCGDVALIPEIAQWFEGGDKPTLDEDEDVAGIVVSRDGRAVEFEKSLRPFPAAVPWCGGSGASFAHAALRCGKTADEAVLIACELDLYSGGQVEVVHL